MAVKYIVKKSHEGLPGLKRARPATFRRLSTCKRTVSRPYGGQVTHADLRERITRAFLLDEVKQMKLLAVSKDKSSKKQKKK